jgi:metallophosphoesterase superfamily enzyme
MKTFAYLTDLHYGFERKSGHKVPLHDLKAFGAAYEFLKDFKPDVLIAGGDFLDCGVISHHNKQKKRSTEGLRLLSDAEGLRAEVLKPLEALKAKELVYQIGNHEDWVDDLIEENPGIEGMVEIRKMLALEQWRVVPQGGYYNLGKLTFLHGDQLSGGDHVAKAAVVAWERSVRFGHFHTYQTYTKVSPIHEKLGRTGIAVPCLCTKDPKYGEGKANRWVQGLNWGYVMPDGSYHDYVSIITNGRLVANGKVYRG